jgi:hypothetical protein
MAALIVCVFAVGGAWKEVEKHCSDDLKHHTFEDLIGEHDLATGKETDLKIAPVKDKIDMVNGKMDRILSRLGIE